MKLLILAFLIPCVATAQKSDIIIDSADNKSVIWSKTMIWIAKTWKSSDNVIDLKDQEGGTIIVKGGLTTVPVTLGIRADGQTLTHITFRIKDGKAKIEFSDTYFKSSIGSTWYLDDGKNPKQKEKWRKPLLIEMDDMILSYKNALFSKPDDF